MILKKNNQKWRKVDKCKGRKKKPSYERTEQTSMVNELCEQVYIWFLHFLSVKVSY